MSTGARCRTGSAEARPVASAADIARCLDAVRLADAASVPVLGAAEAAALHDAVGALPFRRAQSVVGSGEKAVTQDFEICDSVPIGGLIGAWITVIEDLLNRAIGQMPSPPFARVVFNDAVAQRYQPVRCGISPHRDHLRYVNLVANLVISGRGRFFICDDRGGANAREIPGPAGSLLVMRAPGFDGLRHRPFHMLGEVTRERLILGLRQDSRKTGQAG